MDRGVSGDVHGHPRLLAHAALVLAGGVDQVHLDLDGGFASQHPIQRAAQMDLAILAECVADRDVNTSYQQLHRCSLLRACPAVKVLRAWNATPSRSDSSRWPRPR